MDLTSKELMRQMEIMAQVSGKPAHEFADSAVNDIEFMRLCCDSEVFRYWQQIEGTRISAVPFYFERLAVLSRKNKDYTGELRAIERWRAIISDYKAQSIVKAKQAALTHKSPRSIAILARTAEAMALLRAQKAAAKAGCKG